MSDFNPSPQAIGKAGDAFQNLIGTIYDKLNAAEANTQYKAAYESLRKSTIDFNNSLATDPEPEKYVEKWDKAKDSIWKNSTRMVKNQDALKALQDTWQNMDIDQYKSVSGIQTQARVNKTIDQAAQTSELMAGDNTRSTDTRKKGIRDTWAALIATGAVNRQTIDAHMQLWDKRIDQSAMEEGLRQVATTPVNGQPPAGWEYALGLIDNPEFTKLFPSLTPADRDTIRGKIKDGLTVQDSEDKRANDKLEEPLGDMYSKVMMDEAGLPDFKKAIDQSRTQWRGKEAGERDVKWAGKYHQLITEQRAEQRAEKGERGGYDTEAANDLQTKMFDPEMTKEQKFDLIAKTKGLTTEDRKKLGASIKNSSTALHDSAERIQGMAAKDANGNPGPLTAEDVKIGHAMLQEMIDKQPDLSPDKIGKETDTIIEYLSQRKVRDAIKKAFQGMPGELLQAETLTQESTFGPLEQTAEGTRLQNAVAQEQKTELAGKKITADYVGLDQKNRPIFRDAQGRIYYKSLATGKEVWWYQETTARAGRAQSTWLTLK